MAERISVSTPAGSAGVLRFYETEGKGLKLEPSFVVLLTAVFILLVLIAKLVWK